MRQANTNQKAIIEDADELVKIFRSSKLSSEQS